MPKRKRKPEAPLTEQQKKAVRMLYEGSRIQDIAAALGVHRTTVWRWECKRGFVREWKRIDYNYRRKYERRQIRMELEREEYWAKKVREAEEKLHELAPKRGGKPGKEWQKAYKEYEKAIGRGHTLAELMERIYGSKRKKRQGLW